MDYFFWHKTFGTNFFLNIQGRSQNYIKTSKLRHGGGTKNFIFGLSFINSLVMLLGVGWDSSTKWGIGWSISIGRIS
jgi:aminoglycoside N3'-acetyltransferase